MRITELAKELNLKSSDLLKMMKEDMGMWVSHINEQITEDNANLVREKLSGVLENKIKEEQSELQPVFGVACYNGKWGVIEGVVDQRDLNTYKFVKFHVDIGKYKSEAVILLEGLIDNSRIMEDI